MELQPLRKGDIKVGKPLPWPVYDKNGNLLLKEDMIVQTANQLEVLLTSGLFRNMDWKKKRVIKEVGGDSPYYKNPQLPKKEKIIPFHTLNFGVGDTFQMQYLTDTKDKYYVKLIGYVEKKSLLATAPSSDGQVILMREGQPVIIRCFSGKGAYAFKTHVIKTCNTPHSYVHLHYPSIIEELLVRKSNRVRVNLISSVYSVAVSDQKISCLLIDLSTGGAKLSSKQPLGDTGGKITISVKVTVSGNDVYLNIPAIIRSVADDESEPSKKLYGVEFKDLPLQEVLAIQGFIYENELS